MINYAATQPLYDTLTIPGSLLLIGFIVFCLVMFFWYCVLTVASDEDDRLDQVASEQELTER